jgi:hypothetical protein
MAHIPDDLVLRCIEHIVECNCELYNTQAGAEVATSLGDSVHNVTAQFLAELPQLGQVKVFDVHWVVHGICTRNREENQSAAHNAVQNYRILPTDGRTADLFPARNAGASGHVRLTLM